MELNLLTAGGVLALLGIAFENIDRPFFKRNRHWGRTMKNIALIILVLEAFNLTKFIMGIF